MQKDFETRLSVGDVTVTERDVEMLRAIDRFGSMYKAAEELGRSYPHLQRRVVELESAAGDLTERNRGGEGGGGTVLTSAARDLVRQFSRHRAELRGVASVTDTVFKGTVTNRDGEIGIVETPAGLITALVPPDATRVEVGVRSDVVVLHRPGKVADGDTSLRNELAGTVLNVETGDAIAEVTVELDGGQKLVALITRNSKETLSLEPESRIVASFKATAARGVARSD